MTKFCKITIKMLMINHKVVYIYQYMVRRFKWLFVKRLAICPPLTNKTQNYEELTINSIMIFEWQSMPKGYRWF